MTKKTTPKKDYSNFLNWLQTITSLISVAGVILAFVIFFKKNEELQHQINSLDTIARQSIQQTKILSEQLGFDTCFNKLNVSLRNSEIEPLLSIDFTDINEEFISANIINTGKSANIKRIKENKENCCEIDIPFKSIGDGKERAIFFRYKKPYEDKNKVLDFTIFYEDIYHKSHLKRFKFETNSIKQIIENKFKNSMM